MRRRYIEFNGRKFQLPGDLDLGPQILDFLLAHGDEALRALEELAQTPEYADTLRKMLDDGLLEKARGRFRLTPRAINAMQRKALMEVFAHLPKGARDSHAARPAGAGGERIEGTRPYEFGDPVSELDLGATLRNALARAAELARAEPGPDQRPETAGPPQVRPGRLALRLQESDFEIQQHESRASCSTVVLLDMSGSMARFHRFLQAKKCAMALIALVRQRFPQDTIDLVGFHSGAEVIPEERLPLLMPKPVTRFDPRINLRVPLRRLEQAPQHFTNLHLGLLKARRLLQRRAGDQRMIFIITDGQPTAHVQGEYAYLIYPPHESSHWATLSEARRIARGGVRICAFALTDDYWDMDWLGFVEQLGKLTRGVTFQCASSDLAACVMESYLSGHRRRAFLS